MARKDWAHAVEAFLRCRGHQRALENTLGASLRSGFHTTRGGMMSGLIFVRLLPLLIRTHFVQHLLLGLLQAGLDDGGC
jgi:hypothetical protein